MSAAKKATDLVAEIAHALAQIGDPHASVEVQIGDFRSPITDVFASPRVPWSGHPDEDRPPRVVVLRVHL